MAHRNKLIFLFVLAAVAVFPFLAGKFHVYMATEIMIFSVFGISFFLLLGHSGFLSFGHAAYFGLGAYCTALYLIRFPEHSLVFSLVAGGVAGLAGGLIIGIFLLRLSKIYYSLATVAFGQMLWAIAWKWRSLTGGDDGLAGWSGKQVLIPLVGSFSLSNLYFLYFLVALVAVLTIALCWLFTKTPLGNTLSALKSNPDRIQFLGINPNAPKLCLFAFSGFCAGISGALYALFEKMVSPEVMGSLMSFDIVVMTVLGGYSSFAGPILGSAVYVYLSEYLSSFTNKWQLILGVLFVFIVLYSPNGLLGIARELKLRFAAKRDRHV